MTSAAAILETLDQIDGVDTHLLEVVSLPWFSGQPGQGAGSAGSESLRQKRTQ